MQKQKWPLCGCPHYPQLGNIISCPWWEATGEGLSSWGRYLERWKGTGVWGCALNLDWTFAHCFTSVSFHSYTMYVAYCTVPREIVLCVGAGLLETKKKQMNFFFSVLILAPTGAQYWRYSCGWGRPQGTCSWTRKPDMGIIMSPDCLGVVCTENSWVSKKGAAGKCSLRTQSCWVLDFEN